MTGRRGATPSLVAIAACCCDLAIESGEPYVSQDLHHVEPVGRSMDVWRGDARRLRTRRLRRGRKRTAHCQLQRRKGMAEPPDSNAQLGRQRNGFGRHELRVGLRSRARPGFGVPQNGDKWPAHRGDCDDQHNGILQPFFPFLSYGFYNAATFAPFGWQNVTVPSCSTQVAGPALPSAAAIGASGAFYTETEYEDCAPGSAATGTSVVTWSLESDSGYPLFCSNATNRDLANAVVGTGSFCFEVATDGTLGSRFRLTATGEGETLTVRNF